MHKRIIASLLAAILIAGSTAALSGCGENSGGASSQTESATESKTENGSGDAKKADGTVAEGAILQVFSWDFNTIKESMPDIAAAGFTAVQTSPVNTCLEGEGGGMELYGDGKWYYHYQPTDFKIGNYQLGTREEFKSMCDEAHKYGVSVLVDVIANHTTPELKAVSKDLIKAGGGSLETLFHKNNEKDIKDYGNRLLCTTAKMGGLPDINTERPSFQEYFFKFINDCIDCGADGFRYDTAKHIGLPDDPKEDDGFANDFWDKVRTETKDHDSKFIYGEVLQGDNDRIADYIKAIGRTTASVYGSKIRSAIAHNSLSSDSVKEYWIGDAPANIVTWVESHDNYINDGTWRELNDDQVILGWAVISARKDGTPLFFSRPYESSEENSWGMNRIGPQGDDMYKDDRVAAVNLFRTAMKGEEENLVNPNDDISALMIERGKKGVVIVNSEKELSTGFAVSLPDGEYTDRADNKTVYTVKGGKLTSEKPIAENSVVVLYNDGYKEREAAANAGVAKDTIFKTDKNTIETTLTLENAEKGTYSIDGAEAVEFKNGDKLTINKPAEGNVVKVELRAENVGKTPTYERVEFTFEDAYKIAKGSKVYFQHPGGDWADDIYIYIYNTKDDENREWPGEAMKKEQDGKYSYTFSADWDTPLIIFNDGDSVDSVQYPSGKGLVVEPDKTYTAE